MKSHERMIQYMHEYLDEEITAEHEQELKSHLKHCMECQNHFHELEKSIALVKSTSHIQAPSDFTANVMNKLPKEKAKISLQRWLRLHPVLTAASLFLVFMMGSLVYTWNEEQDFSVTKKSNIIVQNDTVIVPEGEVVKGDIVVRNGTIRIEGQVDGNVTVINGEKYMASAGQVTGEIEEVNAVFEWVWLQIKKTAIEVLDFFKDNDQTEQSLENGVAVFYF